MFWVFFVCVHDKTRLHPFGPTLVTHKKTWRLRIVLKKKKIQLVEEEVVGVEGVNGRRPRLTFGARHSAPSKVVPPSERLKGGERGGGKKSPPLIAHPLPARSHSIASVSVPLHHHLSHPREE